MAAESALVALSRRLDAYHLDRFRLLCTGVDVRTETNDKELDFQLSTLLRRLKQKIPHDEAVLFCCQILEQLGYKRTDDFRKTANSMPDYNFRTRHPNVDCMLTVLKFIDNLGQYDYTIVRTYICGLTEQSIDRVHDRPDLVSIMFDENIVSVDNMSSVLKLAKQFNRGWMFDDFVKRQEQQHCTKVLPQPVSSDGAEKRHTEEKTSSIQEQSTQQVDQQHSDGSDKVANWLAKQSDVPENPPTDAASLYSDRTGTTAPYSVEDVQNNEDPSGNVGELVLANNSSKETEKGINPNPSLSDALLNLLRRESQEGNWYELGNELGVATELLDELQSKNRSDSYKLEEVLCTCSGLTLDDVTRLLETLKLQHLVEKLKID